VLRLRPAVAAVDMDSSAVATVEGAQSQQWAAFLGQVGNTTFVKDTVVARG
jgi:hypothetical protein